MSSWRSFCIAIHLTSLGLWAGAIAISGAAAAVVFPTLRDMNVSVPGLSPMVEKDHFRFAAGAVAQRVFLITDILSFACALAAATSLLAMVVWLQVPVARSSMYIRALALGVALASLAAMLFVVTPQINTAAQLHLAAAKSGDLAAAALHRQAVDDLHPIASYLMGAEFFGALIAAFVGAWSVVASPAADKPSAKPKPAEYPEPDLLRNKRL